MLHVGEGDAEGFSGELNEGMGGDLGGSDEVETADNPFVAYDADFGRGPVLHGGDERDHAGGREVDVLRPLFGAVTYEFWYEGNRCGVGEQKTVAFGRQGGYESIFRRHGCSSRTVREEKPGKGAHVSE